MYIQEIFLLLPHLQTCIYNCPQITSIKTHAHAHSHTQTCFLFILKCVVTVVCFRRISKMASAPSGCGIVDFINLDSDSGCCSNDGAIADMAREGHVLFQLSVQHHLDFYISCLVSWPHSAYYVERVFVQGMYESVSYVVAIFYESDKGGYERRKLTGIYLQICRCMVHAEILRCMPLMCFYIYC